MPILAGQGMDQGPFLPYPSKLHYMWRDLERRAGKHGLPYRRPSTYPPNTLLTVRIGMLAAAEGRCKAFTEETFKLHWVEDRPIGTDDNIGAALTSLGKDVNDVVTRAQSPRNKEMLRAQTERARALGMFGSPSFLVGDELFWGDDRLEEALDWAAPGQPAHTGACGHIGPRSQGGRTIADVAERKRLGHDGERPVGPSKIQPSD